MISHTYSFERDNGTIKACTSQNRVSTDAVNAVMAAIADLEGWTWEELTDQDDPTPRIRISSPDDACNDLNRSTFEAALRTWGIKVAKID